MELFFAFLDFANGLIYSNAVLFVVLGAGALFTLWSVFIQYRALTHGVALTLGRYDHSAGKGALSHFQALSAALSATVGLGNIGGVALAVAIGGPGAVFWMWVVGFLGMAVKSTEVTLSLLYRNAEHAGEPHGGPMWVARKALAEMHPKLAGVGKFVGGIFCVALIIGGFTGGNMFQAWNVADLTYSYFGVPQIVVGVILAVTVGLVIIGGIRRIGQIAAFLTPFMCGTYVLAGLYVLVINAELLPQVFRLIFTHAFSPTEAQGAFIGGGVGYAFLWGMKRAIFSNEAGFGSAPIAHSAVKTTEPVTEGIVAGLEPFVDTLVVCTITALVILVTGLWRYPPEATWETPPPVVKDTAGSWTLERSPLPPKNTGAWKAGDSVFALLDGSPNPRTGGDVHRLDGTVVAQDGQLVAQWGAVSADAALQLKDRGVFASYTGATLTARAFDQAHAGLGRWMVTLAVWLFAVSTMISWSYYGEQGVVYLFGERWVTPYRLLWCGLGFLACTGFIRTPLELDNISTFGFGLMLVINLPLTILFAHKAMRAYRAYLDKLKRGELKPRT
ncbi:MAG: alanine/glycine:cation symporter family protein [Nevskiales bacterium]